MKSSIAIASLSTMFFAACAPHLSAMSHSAAASVAETQATARNVADGTRGSMTPGGTFEFKQLKIAVLATMVDSSAGTPRNFAKIRLQEGGATEEMTVGKDESLNWHGYHVAISAVHGPGEPGGARVELSVASVASLPQCVGKPVGKDSPWPCR